ncbi:MAG: hypothetical protein H6Q68_734 [Firmicutes bacterium]|nr:hypothetical protein [Bacillota bacterium]
MPASLLMRTMMGGVTLLRKKYMILVRVIHQSVEPIKSPKAANTVGTVSGATGPGYYWRQSKKALTRN